MDRPDIPLNALRVFEVAVRQGSFTRAAVELRVTQAAVSHQIARLEDLLGKTLFLRTSAGLVPTDEGRALFPVLEHGFDAMARTLDRISGGHHVEVLKVGVVTTFALGWLMPRLPAFQRAHPEIDLRLSTHNNRVEIGREGLDMAIRFGVGSWPGVEALPLLETPMSPLCAPSVAAALHHPEDLAQQTLLRSYRSDEWPRWFAEIGAICPPLTGPVFDSSLALAEVAAGGAGVALLPVAMLSRHLEEGRLVQPFGHTVSTGRYYLTHPADRAVTPAMSGFSDWLRSELGSGAEG
ncbi:LysR family transcriptional regulator [Acuticoccus sediminis]|uniref:LysR family transcriptional regulator n=1 Tax=Acuticoccus sediminis TaxID=2184697 RepID=A0A8B2NSX0_9HYPH|nr:LysR family transcriptional regulator [Acuticoccus sediminis]RAI01619.1 LysR family transcriptional regulator [Acuticoccus sediminis]